MYLRGPFKGWTLLFGEDTISLESTYARGSQPAPWVLRFNPEITHATVLGRPDRDGIMLPALLHLPEEGSVEIAETSDLPVSLHHDARRRGMGYVEGDSLAATSKNPKITYTLRVRDHPPVTGIESDRRFRPWRLLDGPKQLTVRVPKARNKVRNLTHGASLSDLGANVQPRFVPMRRVGVTFRRTKRTSIRARVGEKLPW